MARVSAANAWSEQVLNWQCLVRSSRANLRRAARARLALDARRPACRFEALHDLRVAWRRERVLLRILRKSTRGRTARRHLRKREAALRRAFRSSGQVRDAEVMRLRGAGRLRRAFGKRWTPEEIAALGTAIERCVQDSRERYSPKRALRVARAWEKRWFTDVATLQSRRSVSIAQLHRLRIRAKELRYLRESFGIPSQPLPKIQGLLGDLHDAWVRWCRFRDECL